MKTLKKLTSSITAASLMMCIMPIMPYVFAEENNAMKFNPETVMWTNNKIENILAETGGIYENAAEVNPNASTSGKENNMQNPYGKPGEILTDWAYSEFLWTNSYPIGNGRMAGMIAGGIDKEVIQLNEDTAWDGSPYGTLKNENGNTLTTLQQTNEANKITVENPTSGSVEDGWKYFRGANEDGNPAEIGAADVTVGDEAFRTQYPDFANKSLSNQALNISNEKTQDAVQGRWNLEKMVEATFLGSPTRQRAYKSFVEVYLDFKHQNENASNYTKSLDMKTGIVTVEYDYDGSHYKRESFASYPDQVVVTHVESDADLDFSAELHTYHSEKNGYYSYEKISDNEVKVTAAITNGSKDNNEPGTVNAIKFEARMLLKGDGAFSVTDNKTVAVKGGKTADIYVVGATNYVDYLNLDNSKPARDCDTYMTNVKSKDYTTIKERHIADFSEQFNKTSIHLENTDGADYSNTPTEKRVREDINGKSGFLTGAASRLSDANKSGVYSTYSKGDNELAALEFNYGKYLILSGSRDGRKASGYGEIDIPESQPLNLTGKWNAAFSASWNGKYTININTEMNYWAAQPLNIGDSERAFIDTFNELAKSGAITAANQYGVYNERGDDTYQEGDPWVMHHNYDLWRGTQPIDNATAGLWPTGGVWLLDHAWQYYQFNKDEEYLAEVYPYMIGAAKFFTQFLVVDPKTGYLITAASCSPEQGGVQPGPAMDTQLVRNLYDTVQKASEILGKTAENKELLDKIAEQMPSSYLADEQGKLAPNIIDNAGLIREWARGDVTFDISKTDASKAKWTITNPFKNNETLTAYDHAASNNSGHRHCSHLWEMFPGTHLSAYSADKHEQDIFKAFQKSVSARGAGSGQGWGLAWRINLNARALDGNTASNMLEQLFTTRTSPNMFDQHPNFQIDGNYGATSGIIEMLVQSHDNAIDLLPALPDKWTAGSIKGINTREDATVDIAWEDNKPTEAKIHAKADGDINVRSKYMASAVVSDENGDAVETTLNDDSNMLTFAAENGKTYTITDFGSNVVEGNKTYKAADTTEFYASDNGQVPKIDGNGVDVGYIYNRENVKIGYAVNEFDFDGLDTLTLKMSKVRKDNTYVSVTADTPTGTEIANQLITTGDNVLNLKNTDGISGVHKIYILYYRDPYSNDDKYLANANDLIASYKKNTTPIKPTSKPTAKPTSLPIISPTVKPSDYPYIIKSASFNNIGKLKVKVEGEAIDAKLIIAAYTDKGVLSKIKAEDVKGSEDFTIDIEKPSGGSVKLFVWDGLDTMKPFSTVKTADASAATSNPTDNPTTAPTSMPTTSPTIAPTTKPSVNKAAVIQNGTVIGEYTAIRDAVKAAEAINPQSESERVTINVDPGNYEEQVMIEGLHYITLQQTPETSANGRVNLYWHYCTGYAAGDCGLDGRYDPKINWSDQRTWTGYNEGDEQFTAYRLGQSLTGISAISYYDTDGVAHKNVKVQKDHLGDYTDQAALFINNASTDIIVKDLNIVNSIPVMVTEGEKAVGIAPQEDRNADNATSFVLPRRDNLAVCDENTPMNGTSRVKEALAISNDVDKIKALEALENLTAGESAYLVRSDKYNERGHALSINGDRITLENVRARGNQDSVFISSGRIYFKNCDLIGGTDYIYGDATAVFDSCKLGAEGMSNKDYGATITAANHEAANPYGYLFYNCEIYNVLDNITKSTLGRPWRQDAQITFFNTLIDDNKTTGKSNAGISDAGWSDMSDNKKELARFFEYGTKTRSGAAADTSKRVVNASVDDGGQGMGAVLDKWQILEFNPRNYFNSDYWINVKQKSVWDPMNFGTKYLSEADKEIEQASVTIPEGSETTVSLPSPSVDNIEFHWESASDNAIVSEDGKSLTVARPASGESAIKSSIILYAMNNSTGFGDKKVIPVTINPTTDTTNVFAVMGTVSMTTASDTNQTVTLMIKKGDAVIKTQDVTITAGETSQEYTMENIPVGEYTIYPTAKNTEYNVKTDSQTITGTASGNVTYNVEIQKMAAISVTDTDFSLIIPTVTTASGFAASIYTADGTETANLTAGNKVYKLTKDADITIARNVGVSFDLKSLLKNGTSLDNTKALHFSYDFLLESSDYLPKTPNKRNSFFDLATSMANAGNNAADQTRFVRWDVMANWGQINMYPAANGRINGDKTQFDSNSKMANKWYRITADIDLVNKTITSTLYNRDEDMAILNNAPFTIVASEADYPTDIDLGNLCFNIYMDSGADVTNKIEYYIDNITIEYQDYE